MEEINIVYSSDDNYVHIMGTSIVSLIMNNKSLCNNMTIHILDNGISESNKKKLEKMVNQFSANIHFYNVREKLKLLFSSEVVWNTTTYARLFIQEFLSDTINRVLYIDPDTIIVDSIEELYFHKIDEKYIMYGVLDRYNMGSNARLELKNCIYINAGVLLLDLKKWRENKISDRISEMIDKKEWVFADQDILNKALENKIGILSPEYNEYMFSLVLPYEEAMKISYRRIDSYYSREDYENAKKNPVIIHFSGNLFNRPWHKKSKQTMHELFDKYYKMTPWSTKGYQKRKYTKKLYTTIYFFVCEKILYFFWKRKKYKTFTFLYNKVNDIPNKIKGMIKK